MERLTEWRNGHGSLLRGDGYTRLAEYEDLDMTPEEINMIVDRYGRGLTLRTSVSERLDLIRGIDDKRLREIVAAEKDGRLVIMSEPLDETCGSCIRFQRDAGTAHGYCDCRKEKYFGRPLFVTQSRKRCRDDYTNQETEDRK